MSNLQILGVDVLDVIISFVDGVPDLISLALTCQWFAAIVIPNHTEYRTIVVHRLHPGLVSHLADRRDLARNIRSIQIGRQLSDFATLERVPARIRDITVTDAGRYEDNGAIQMAFVRALKNMEFLQDFQWAFAWPKIPLPHLVGVFDTLRKCVHLRSLSLVAGVSLGPINGGFSQSPNDDSGWETFPVWQVSGLQKLSLTGSIWGREKYGKEIQEWLLRSPDLEHLALHFPTDNIELPDLRFPLLSTVVLRGSSPAAAQPDEPILRFLAAHPTVTNLTWYPRKDETRFLPGSLPNIANLTTDADAALALLVDGDPRLRPIERLYGFQINASSLDLLRTVNRDHLRCISVRYDTLDSLKELARIFPGITTLGVSNMRLDGLGEWEYPWEEYIDALTHFRNVHLIRDPGLWRNLQALEQRVMHSPIRDLLERCPSLERIQYNRLDLTNSENVLSEVVFSHANGSVSWVEREYINEG
ncbi:hypothetical protein BDN72DRAFT_341551 [Pluteus cervinus]|uniref:Uncharacterized protein n=1 Tax=Pluteus cervinus TaxID=181527 RepID=A0ACD3AC35_9AGAR|nr:hypothetical protein BDN72DRAFT_341551 [Pluteus cervinus]